MNQVDKIQLAGPQIQTFGEGVFDAWPKRMLTSVAQIFKILGCKMSFEAYQGHYSTPSELFAFEVNF